MANIVFPDGSSPLFNPAAYNEANFEARKTKTTGKTEKAKKRTFTSFFNKAAETAHPAEKLPVSEESLQLLLQDIHSTGDALSKRPFLDEIKAYKQAVRNFVSYVVENSFDLKHGEGIPNYLRPGYTGPRGTDESQNRKRFTMIQVIDKKLEELAAAVLQGHSDQLSILAKTDEIKGLLVDLME